MPTTRSQAADDKTTRVYEDAPASPSENAPASTINPRSTEPTATTEPTARLPHSAISRPTAETAATVKRTRAPSMGSQRSTASAIARIRRAELEAEEQLAEIRRQELQIQAALIKKRLATDVATIREETDRESIGADEAEETDRRISEWLQRSHVRGEGEARHRSPQPQERRCPPTDTPHRVAFETPQRQRSPTPARSRERGIERLADTLEKMTRSRVSSRQELPIFSGAVGEWLPFKAAMRESSHIYGLTPAENLARLRACLRGEARQTVSALLYTATEPSVIMKTLEQCYGRPEIIIDQALEDIRRLPRLSTTASEINGFAIKLQNIVTVITCLDEKGYLQNPMLTRQITDKLSPHIRSKWCDYAEENGHRGEPEIVTLSRFLMQEADRAVRHSYSNATPPITLRTAVNKEESRRPNERRRGVKVYATTEDAIKKNACLCCGGDHPTPHCKKIEVMPVAKRWEWAKEARICFLCLNSKHRRFKCRSKRCGKEECRMSHHALLHIERPQEPTPEEESAITASAHLSTKEREVLLKVCPVILRGRNGKELETYALLDEGSTISLIDREIANAIGAQGPTRALNIHGVTTSQREPESQSVDIAVRGKGRTEFYDIKTRTVRNLNLGHQSIATKQLKYAHLRTLKPTDVCYAEAKPRMLIGADQWHLIVTRKLLAGTRNQPAASLTRLGWVIHGAAPRSIMDSDDNTVLHVRAQTEAQRRDDELNELVKTHYHMDSIGITAKRKPIAAEERAKEIFERTARLSDGRYEVGLPWKTDGETMPPSYDMAFKRLRGLEKRMDRSLEFKAAYTEQMKKLLVKGYAKPCEENHEDDPHLWYLPHFAAINPNKPEKIRLVFDAAARMNGVCLNDALLDGPDMLQTLHGVLFRFRANPVAVTADIKEMFLRIKIRKEDQAAQHFLWRGEERTGPPRRYRMASMIFGARSSPFLAHSVRNKNATECKDSYPLAYKAITRDHYMDDWLGSFNNVETATRAIKEVLKVHGRAGFELASWSTNRPELLEVVPPENRSPKPRELGANTNTHDRALGIIWIAETDELAFNTNMPRVHEDVRKSLRIPTKRETLAAVMSIFDPLGLLSPYIITAKIMLQGLWRKKIDWDDPLPPDEAAMFEDWYADLTHIKDLRIPRCYDTHTKTQHRQLHVFCDASEEAYATVAYWRFVREDGSIKVAIVAGKAKVASIKAQSIPRMELQAGLIGARLASEIVKEHGEKTEVILWSDSKTVLHWIRNDSSRYTPFVAHRLGEIAELTQADQWRWTPTAHYVADDATRRGNTQLRNDDRWFTGPRFLYETETRWPKEDVTTLESQKEVTIAHTDAEPALLDMSRFSSYERLVRATARVLLFIAKCRRRATELNQGLIEEAENLLVKEAQKDSFGEEIAKLQRNKTVDKSSRLYRLDPKYGEDRIIRLNGRINAATVPDRMKEPPIIDGAHPLVRLRILEEHRKNYHVGREQIVNTLRQEWWVIRLRPAVRKVLSECVKCKTIKTQPKIPVKGDLPKARLNAYARPFSRCGLDCFGPMWITVGRRREKRWGMIFTCLVTRAIHLETLASLSTDSAIMALRRMAARRGWPAQIISDNATNFRGSAVELREAYKEWLPQIKDYALVKRIDWRYIDTGAPNQGGAWERLIRSVKTALATTLNQRAPKEEILITLLAEIEHTVNSRPLTHVPVNAEDPEALTPNHFLLGTSVGLPCVGEANLADRKTWRIAQALANMFWTRWIREYLPTLVPRNDVRKISANPEKGDVVIISDGLLPRNVWPRGQVVETYAGPDGVVRSVDVRTKGGIFRRPTRRLIVLRRNDGCEDLRRGEDVTDEEHGPI